MPHHATCCSYFISISHVVGMHKNDCKWEFGNKGEKKTIGQKIEKIGGRLWWWLWQKDKIGICLYLKGKFVIISMQCL